MIVFIFQIIFSIMCALGAVEVGRLICRKWADESNIHVLSEFFIGIMPLVLFEVLVSACLYRENYEMFTPIFILRLIYFGLGGLSALKLTKLSIATFCFEKRLYISVSLVLFLLFLPSFLIPVYVHPTWDSDATGFWIPKLADIFTHGFLSAPSNSVHPDYFSLMNRVMGSLLFPMQNFLAESLMAARLFYLLVFFVGCYFFTARFPKIYAACMLIPLLSGFPIKWINGYQDHWVAFFFIGVIWSYLEKRNFDFWIFTALLAISKNEGLALAVVSSMVLWQRPQLKQVYFFIFLLCPMIIWKVYAKFNFAPSKDLLVEWVGWDTLLVRLSIFKFGFLKAMARRIQGSWVDGLVAFILLIFGKFSWNGRCLRVLFCLIAAVLIPQLIILFFTNFDYQWHLDTTLSRISSAGLMGLVYFIFYRLNYLNRAQ